jgi:hypothetical protein
MNSKSKLRKTVSIATSDITFNLPCLPAEMDFADNKKIVYFYNTTGEKMLRAVSVGGAAPTMTYYFGPFVHEGTLGGASSLKYVITPEGRIINSGTDNSPVWSWESKMKHGFWERSKPKTVKQEQL